MRYVEFVGHRDNKLFANKTIQPDIIFLRYWQAFAKLSLIYFKVEFSSPNVSGIRFSWRQPRK
jgi:hypothetical protein